MLAGGGRDEVVTQLATALGRRVMLVAADGALRVEHCPGSPTGRRPDDTVPGYADPVRFGGPRPTVLDAPALELVAASDGPVDVVTIGGTPTRAVPVTAAPGRRWALLAESVPGTDVDAHLSAATSALRIDAVRRDARADAIAASASWLVDELRFGSARPSDEMARLAMRLGVRVDAPHAAASLHYAGPDLAMWTTATGWIDAPVQVIGERAWSVLGGDPMAKASRISERLGRFARGEVLVAVGTVVNGAAATRESFEQADRVLAVMRHRRASGGRLGPVATSHDLGPAGLLLSTPRAALEAFVAAQIGPVLGRPELLQTLAAWCATGGRRQETARAVTVHRNSIAYRLDRINELIGVDLHDPDVIFRLRTALTAHELIQALHTSQGVSPGSAD